MEALPKVWFSIMNTVNASMQVLPFMLKMGRSLRVMPLLVLAEEMLSTMKPKEEEEAMKLIERLVEEMEGLRDCLLVAKILQVHHANKDRSMDLEFKVGENTMLEMAHWRRDYMQKKSGRVAKFMPRWDGPYEILEFPELSTYKLAMASSSVQCTMFHAAHLKKHMENDNDLFPDRKMECPGPIMTEEGSTEYFVDHILDERPQGRGKQYLVRWKGNGPEADLWLPQSKMLETEALLTWKENLGTHQSF